MIYLLLGEAMSGKTTFLKNLNCTFVDSSIGLRNVLLNGDTNIAIDDYCGIDYALNSMLKYLYDCLNGKSNIEYFMKIDKSKLPKDFNIFIATKPMHLKNISRGIIARCKVIYFKQEDFDVLRMSKNG